MGGRYSLIIASFCQPIMAFQLWGHSITLSEYKARKIMNTSFYSSSAYCILFISSKKILIKIIRVFKFLVMRNGMILIIIIIKKEQKIAITLFLPGGSWAGSGTRHGDC